MKNFPFFILIILFLFGCNQGKPVTTEPVVDVESILKNISAPEFPDQVFKIDVQSKGNDSLFDYKKIINDEISECSESGGGKVILPRGYFFSRWFAVRGS